MIENKKVRQLSIIFSYMTFSINLLQNISMRKNESDTKICLNDIML